MNIDRKIELWKEYGEYNCDGYYILDHEKWDFYARNLKSYKRKILVAKLFFLIPIAGFVLYDLTLQEMGLSAF